MYKFKLQQYMTEIINSYVGSNYTSIGLDYKVIIHLVPSWTGDTSYHAKSIAKSNITALYGQSIEVLYPELMKLSNEDKAYATTRYKIELEALNNFINYYSDRQIPSNKSFQELFETFIIDTSDEATVNGSNICLFEENDTIYLLPQQQAIDMIKDNTNVCINPHTGLAISSITATKLRKHYKVQIQMQQ